MSRGRRPQLPEPLRLRVWRLIRLRARLTDKSLAQRFGVSPAAIAYVRKLMRGGL